MTTKTKSRSSTARSRNGEPKSLEDLFLADLQDILWAEQQIVKALPKMAQAARSSELRSAFKEHLDQSEEHIRRLEEVLEGLGVPVKAKKCEAMAGLLEEAQEHIKDFKDSPALDAALIGSAQKVEHYEIAAYGTLVAYADCLGHNEAARLLGETLEEEKETDVRLTELAEAAANIEAAAGDMD